MTALLTNPMATRSALIVDGTAACRWALRAQLTSEGLDVIEAGSGVECLEQARRFRPDLILLDQFLPDLDGFETIRRLKGDPLTRAISVVLHSDGGTTHDRARGLDLGAVDFISKNTDPIELRARVRAAIRTRYLQELLEQRAQLDGLTGLGNRLALQERLETTWQMCRRRGNPMAVILADLDHFKRINDEYGHGTGDEILRRAAAILRSSVRGCDFVARYGGEEFVVVAPDCDLEGGIAMAERFRNELSGPCGAADLLIDHRVTTSVGIADTQHLGCSTPGSLIGHADRALYRAKSFGRDAVWYWDGDQGRPAASEEPLLNQFAGARIARG